MMRFIERLTTPNKALLLIMALVMLIALPIIAIFAGYSIYKAKQDLLTQVALLTSIISDRSSPSISFNDPTKTNKNLLYLSSQKYVSLACIYDFKGKVFAAYPAQNKKSCDNIDIKNLTPTSFTSDSLIYTQRITLNDTNVIGAVIMHADLSNVSATISRIIITTLLALLCLLVTTYFISRKLQHYITDPIMDLTEQTSKIIADGNYKIRAAKRYNDETGTLVETFNKMMQEIEQRDIEIRNMNINLEEKIIERTKELETQKILAETANDAKSDFLRNMSHEMRTPLHGILSFAKFGQNDNKVGKTSEFGRYFSRIITSGERLTKLVDGIMTLSRYEAGLEKFNYRPGDFGKLIEAATLELSQLAIDKNLRINFANETLGQIKPFNFDYDRIYQVIINIVGNAIKYSNADTNITITCSQNAEFTKFTCKDKGNGIPDNEIEDIFEKFIQSSRTKNGAGGTGLGLAIAKSFITAHNGKIWAENNLDGGASFSFIISNQLPVGEFTFNKELKLVAA